MPRDTAVMLGELFDLDASRSLSLQAQLREQMVAAVLDGRLAANTPLPSSRELAKQLSISRNTVVLAYQHLVDESIILSHQRRGYFVNPDILRGRSYTPTSTPAESVSDNSHWQQRLQQHPSRFRFSPKMKLWREYRYPFLHSQTDPKLIPVNAWRECCRDNLSVQSIFDWSNDHYDEDYPDLVEQLSRRLLPRRGIWTNHQQILVTLGAQNALYLLAQLLMRPGIRVAIEEPGYPDARLIFAASGATLVPVAVDENGLCVEALPPDIDYVYVTPAHQAPTMVKLSESRRQHLLARAREDDFVIIEDDYETEANFFDEPSPSLKCHDTDQRVLYLGSLSKAFAPGLRTGYIVVPEPLVQELRALRFLMMRHPPSNNQRQVARFISLGHYDALMARLFQTYRTRWELIDRVLDESLPQLRRIRTQGGTGFWLDCSEVGSADSVIERAAERGVLLESGSAFWHRDPAPSHYLRLGFASIPTENIEPGLALLREVIQ